MCKQQNYDTRLKYVSHPYFESGGWIERITLNGL